MGYLDKCPTVHGYCWCVGLRRGVIVIALVGMAIGALYLAAYSRAGARLLVSWGAPRAVKSLSTRYVHGVLGVLILVTHALLLSAGCCSNRTLCELYSWSTIVVCMGVLAVNLLVVVSSFRSDLFTYGLTFMMVALCLMLWSVYSVLIVINFWKTLPGIRLPSQLTTLY